MRISRIDRNQPEIVRYLRANHWSVYVTSSLRGGFPDAVAARGPFTALVEIKDGEKPESRQRLTLDEQAFRNTWQGVYIVATSPEDALTQLECARKGSE